MLLSTSQDRTGNIYTYFVRDMCTNIIDESLFSSWLLLSEDSTDRQKFNVVMVFAVRATLIYEQQTGDGSIIFLDFK